jgi:hypothetical protein
MKKPAIITISPHVPLRENSEKAAYALLLMHSVWGEQGEAALLGDCKTATERYHQIRRLDGAKGGFPKYVIKSLEKRIASETLLADAGTPLLDNDDSASAAEEFDACLAEQVDELSERPQFMNVTNEDTTVTPLLPSQHGRVLTNCSPKQVTYLNNFITQMKKNFKITHTSRNMCTEDEKNVKIADPSRVIQIENVESERDKLEDTIRKFNKEQRYCFDAAQECIAGVNPKQMVMFVSGQGGTGKSYLIHALTSYAQILYGKTVGWFGAVLKTAPTGGAAFNIGGHT